MNPLSFELSAPALLYLASVATASLVVAGVAIALVGMWRSAALPLRHTVLVGALAIAVASPLLLMVMGACGVTVFRLPLAHDVEIQPVALPSATAKVDATTLGEVRTANVGTTDDELSVTSTDQFVSGYKASPSETSEVLLTSPEKANWSRLDVARVFVTFWAAGSLASLGMLLIGLARVRRLRLGCRPLAAPRIRRLTTEAAQNLGMAIVPEVHVTALVDAPLSVGIWRPCVIVPEDAVGSLPDGQLRGLLMHELAHVARRDHVVGLLQRAALVMYWWNPLVRQVSGSIATLREEICDDLATCRDASGDGYAAMLVELAGRAVSRRSLPTAIGMFDGSRSEFRRRVERLLENGRSRVTSLDGRMKLVSGVVCLTLLTAVSLMSIRLEANAAESTQAKEETPPVNWPKVLRGTIRDEKGKPVAGAKVRLDLEKIHEFKTGRWDETLVSQEMVTGVDGEYRFETTKYPEMKHRPFSMMMSVTADGYADAKTWNWYTQRDSKVDEKWLDVQVWNGRVVRGRVVTSYGEPVAGAVIKAAGDFGNDNFTQRWAWNPRKSDADGKFSISVPDRDGPVELWIVSREWAPQRVILPKRGDEIADVRLQSGSRVSGRVTLEDGSPVAGAVVAAESVDDGTLDGMTFPVRLAAKTDNDGRYELPALQGIYKFYLTDALETDDRLLGRFIVASAPLPLTLPQRVAVVSGDTQVVDFHGGQGLTVSGTVRWPDGRPTADCEVEASYLAPGNGTGIELDATHTDAEGRYTIRLPKPIDHVSISIIGAYDAKRVWHFAKPTDDAPVKQKSVQFAQLNPLSADLAGVDWVLQLEKDLPEMQPVSEVTTTPAADELSKLQRRYELKQQEMREALDEAKTFEEKSELQLSRDPRVLMADEYLAFEEKHRGTNAGLAALVKLNKMAASVSDRMPKLPAARRELYSRLGEHYLQHPDLDLAFSNVSAGPRSPVGSELLAKAIEGSRHKSVQAAAIYELACFHANLADTAATAAAVIEVAESQSPQDEARMEFMREAAAKLKDVDPTAEQGKALELARRLESEFADVREPDRVFNESGMYWRSNDTAERAHHKPRYGVLAQGLIFDLEKLQVGLPAPDITTEKNGKQAYATQYLGKVTVIVFDQSFNESLERKIADWAKSLSGKPLDVLVVRGKFEGEPNEVDASEVAPLRFVVEGNHGPIANGWSIRQRPTVFVVDGNGVIRARRQSEVPYQLVSELLKGAAAETDRVFEAKTPIQR